MAENSQRDLLIFIREELDQEIHRLEEFIKSKKSIEKHFTIDQYPELNVATNVVEQHHTFKELDGLISIRNSINQVLKEGKNHDEV